MLDSKGAAIRTATFSEFDDRDPNAPKPLVFLSPARLSDGREILSMANRALVLEDYNRELLLDQLDWKLLGVEATEQRGKKATFEATILDSQKQPFLRLTKSYTIAPETFLLQCTLTIENLTDTEQKVRYNLAGPQGLEREAVRNDARKLVAGFMNAKNEIVRGAVDGRKIFKEGKSLPIEPKKSGGNFLWAAATNKYFAAIVVPSPRGDQPFCNWLPGRTGVFYNPDGDRKADSGDETIGLNLASAIEGLKPAGKPTAAGPMISKSTWGPRTRASSTRTNSTPGSASNRRSTFAAAAVPARSSTRWPSAFSA